MATLGLQLTIEQDGINGDKFILRDTTGNHDASANPDGYGGPNPTKSQIKATQVKVSSYDKRQAAGTVSSVADLQQWQEYERGSLGSGAGLFHNTYQNVGYPNPFILPHDPSAITAQSFQNNTVTDLGRTLVRKDFLPAQQGLGITPSDANLSSSIFPDGVYDVEYEVYVVPGGAFSDTNDSLISPGDTLKAGIEYMVEPNPAYGSNQDNILLELDNGNRYFRYQSFVLDADTQILNLNSAPAIYEKYAGIKRYFLHTYKVDGQFLDLTKYVADKCFDYEMMHELRDWYMYYKALKNSVNAFCFPSITQSQHMFDVLDHKYNYLIKCLRNV